MTGKLIFALVATALAPMAGGLISGVDRRLTAWFQSRYGPPVLQPFYDLFKLFGKRPQVVNVWQVFCVWIYLAAAVVTVFLFFFEADLLLIFFVQAVGSVFLVIGALSSNSPFSQVGAQRELIQILTYEPLLVLVFVSIYLVTGSFKIGAIYELNTPLLYKLPLMFIVLGYALTIKLRKSPFDFSTSHHAHQELVKGVMTDYSGPHLAVIELAHWFETILILGLVSLFWSTSLLGIVVLVALTYLAEIFIDNTMSRLTWRWMLGYVWSVGLAMSFVNLIWIYFRT